MSQRMNLNLTKEEAEYVRLIAEQLATNKNAVVKKAIALMQVLYPHPEDVDKALNITIQGEEGNTKQKMIILA